jgi:hypothetical protein
MLIFWSLCNGAYERERVCACACVCVCVCVCVCPCPFSFPKFIMYSKPFPAIYIFPQFTPLLLGPFKCVKYGVLL